MSLFRIITLPLAITIAIQPASAQTPAQLVEQVRRAETAFAASMADRDFAAFAAYVAEESVFFGQRGPTTGKAAVLRAPDPLIRPPGSPAGFNRTRTRVPRVP